MMEQWKVEVVMLLKQEQVLEYCTHVLLSDIYIFCLLWKTKMILLLLLSFRQLYSDSK